MNAVTVNSLVTEARSNSVSVVTGRSRLRVQPAIGGSELPLTCPQHDDLRRGKTRSSVARITASTAEKSCGMDLPLAPLLT